MSCGETQPDGSTSGGFYGSLSSGYAFYSYDSRGGQITQTYDILGRLWRTGKTGLGGTWVNQDTVYDSLGRVSKISTPYFNTDIQWTNYGYDILNRVTSVSEPGGKITNTVYNGLTTIVTVSGPNLPNNQPQSKTTVKNVLGQMINVADAAGNTQYQYNRLGYLSQVTDVAGNIATMAYDVRGRKIAMHDPDMGDWTYTYNVLGEQTSQKDAKNQTITLSYDELGRMKTRVLPNGEGASNWAYGTVIPEIGKLKSVSNANVTETYIYDTLSRPTRVNTSIGGQTYTTTTAYDNAGRVDTITYPATGFKLKQVYDSGGYLIEVRKDSATGLRYWQANSANARGQLTLETLGNNLTTVHDYHPVTDDLQNIRTGLNGTAGVQNLAYGFDVLGNLRWRADYNQAGLSENFTYDNLNRLTGISGGPAPKTYAYFPNGNIQSKSDAGTYTYPINGVRPHAVSSVAGAVNASYSYDNNGNLTGGGGRSIAYTSFNKPAGIAANGSITSLTYDANFNRVIKSNAGGTTIYIGKLYEQVTSGTVVTQKHYLYAGSNLIGIYSQLSNGASNTRYLHTDHLGSVDTITDEAGTLVQRLSYDAFGKRRNPNGTDATSITAQTSRGFTRHEMDDEVGLINMRAREYDPLLGRFITADTMVPGAANSQSYNRYSYALNNPLSRIDPSGQWSLKKAVKKITRAVHDVGERIHIDTAYRAYARSIVAGAYVAGGFFASGGNPAGAIAGARAFYESNKVYNAGGSTGDILKTGAASGVGTYAALEGIGGMYDSWINGIVQTQSVTLATAKVAGQQYVNAQFREAVGNYAAQQGYSLTEFNLGLFGFSALGNVMPGVGSRLDQGTWGNTEWGIRGFMHRGLQGLPFDVVDTILAYQGLPTATAVQYIFSAQRSMPLTGHSLGALDVANLSSFGLAGTSSRVYALPFGKVVSGASVTIGSGDAINGFGLGALLNPNAVPVDTGFLGHACGLYPGCGQ